MIHLDRAFSQLLERAIDMLENKLLRSGGTHIQIWILLVSYGIFRTIHEPNQIELHFNTVVDKLTRITYKLLGQEERLDGFTAQLGVNIPSTTLDRINNEVMNQLSGL
jgi:hypothetical protein